MTTAAVLNGTNVLDAVERLKPVLEKHRDDAENERRLPDAVIDAMRHERFFDLWLPKEYGGVELDLPAYLSLIEALATIDSSAAWVFTNMATAAAQAAYMPEAGAREIFASGALTAGSVIPRGRAVPVEGGYRLSGRWPLTSGCYNAQWLAGNALIFEGDTPRMGPGDIPDFTLMFFPASQCRILDTWYSTGMRGTGSADIVVEDVFVPQHRTFALFTSPSRVAGPLYRLGIAALFLTALSNISLGIARASIDSLVEIAKIKTPTLSPTALANRPTLHAEVARAESLFQAARAYMHEVARELNDAAPAGEIPEALEVRRRLACMNAAESCQRIVDSMYRLAGTSAIYAGHTLDRCLRDIHTVNQHIAVSPAYWEATGQWYFGKGLAEP